MSTSQMSVSKRDGTDKEPPVFFDSKIKLEDHEEQHDDEFTSFIHKRPSFVTNADEDFHHAVIDPYAQSRKWNIAVGALAVVLLVAQLVIISYCTYRLILLGKQYEPEFVEPVAYSVLGSALW